MSAMSDPAPETFSKDELVFLSPLPEHMDVECPICLQVMSDPHIVSCCGHHFCGYCLSKSRSRDDSCPMCKTPGYHSMCDRGLERTINSLGVKCVMASSGCPWVGEFRGLSQHLAKSRRDGDCRFAVVDCRNKCGAKDKRESLTTHEISTCPKRTYQCPHCQTYKASYENVVGKHIPTCNMVLVPCPNGCDPSKTFQRGRVELHLKKVCPLEEIPCKYAWAGCTKRFQRKLADKHCQQFTCQHLAMVTKNAETLNARTQHLEGEVEALKKEKKAVSAELKRQAGELQNLRSEVSDLRKQTREMRTIKRDIQLLQQQLGPVPPPSSYYRF